jgi:cholesterol transport system auxiliary component
MQAKTLLFCALMALSVAACSTPAPKATAAAYDFGLLPDAAPSLSLKALGISDAQVPLAYADAARQEAYANTRWAMSPAALMTQRLRQRAAQAGITVGGNEGVRGAPLLKMELDEFSHVFSSEKESKGVLVARASLLTGAEGARVLAAQRTFRVERAAASPDAAGGARALAQAADDAIGQILQWAANPASAAK